MRVGAFRIRALRLVIWTDWEWGERCRQYTHGISTGTYRRARRFIAGMFLFQGLLDSDVSLVFSYMD